MSDYRNFGDRNRSRNDDERYGSLNERDARPPRRLWRA